MSQPPPTFILGKLAWAAGTYGATVGIRLLTNIVLSRLVTPDIFGILVIVNSIRYGIDLLTDVGIEQNVIHNKNGGDPHFLNTAWTIQILRGIFLSIVFATLSPVLGSFYGISTSIFLLMSAAPLIYSFSSVSVFTLVRNLEVQRKSSYELTAEVLGFFAYITFAFISPTAWSIVLGTLALIGIRSALTYRLPHPAHRFVIDPAYAKQIMHFGKWIMITSLLAYASANLDRIFLGKMITFQILGIYGLAKTISELPAVLANRLSYQIVFPFLATKKLEAGHSYRELHSSRGKLLLLLALTMGMGVAVSDWAVSILYDPRYREAGWMLSVLLIASWFSVLSNLNEANALARGLPRYNSLSNGVRLIGLAIGLPLGFSIASLSGAIAGIIAAEIFRYAALMVFQGETRNETLMQDCGATLLASAVVALVSGLRVYYGLGTAWGWPA